MSIPLFTSSGVLPPFIGDPAAAERSPYQATMVDVVRRLGTSAKRREILRGLLKYRDELRRAGFASAFQWLDGSFVEDLPREPNDIDVVTFAETMPRITPSIGELFQPTLTKKRFLCDTYFVHLSVASRTKLIERTNYWFGLFSHRRVTLEWKGIVQVDLDDARQDAEALDELVVLEVMTS